MRPLLCMTLIALLLQIEALVKFVGEDDSDDYSEEVDLFHRNLSCYVCLDSDAGGNSNRNTNDKAWRLCANDLTEVYRCQARSFLTGECFDDLILKNVSHCKRSDLACSQFNIPACSEGLTDGSAAFRTSDLLLGTAMIIFLVMIEQVL